MSTPDNAEAANQAKKRRQMKRQIKPQVHESHVNSFHENGKNL